MCCYPAAADGRLGFQPSMAQGQSLRRWTLTAEPAITDTPGSERGGTENDGRACPSMGFRNAGVDRQSQSVEGNGLRAPQCHSVHGAADSADGTFNHCMFARACFDLCLGQYSGQAAFHVRNGAPAAKAVDAIFYVFDHVARPDAAGRMAACKSGRHLIPPGYRQDM